MSRSFDWTGSPARYCAAAKERAKLALTDPTIKLTALEKAFHRSLQKHGTD